MPPCYHQTAHALAHLQQATSPGARLISRLLVREELACGLAPQPPAMPLQGILLLWITTIESFTKLSGAPVAA